MNAQTLFDATRARFELPEGVIYLDGNSLGPLPKAAAGRVAQSLHEEWGAMLITAWNKAGWMEMPARIGDRIARLIGAAPGTVMLGDTLSIKVYQLLAAALRLRPGRRVILSDSGNFPSDLYMAQGLIAALGQGHELRVVAPQEVAGALGPEVAVLMLTEVDYRTGRRHDMGALTALAHEHGALTLWDLAHSAGAVPVDLAGTGADLAAGCTYKYLNGGPGAPGFAYARPGLADQLESPLSGWLGHAAPFDFDPEYRPAPGIERLRVGTPPVLQMAALDAALDIWEGLDMAQVHARSVKLSERFIAEAEARCPMLELASPRDPMARGSQVSFRFEHGYAAMQALIARGVIGDYREPGLMRFGFTPLYLGEDEVLRACEILQEVMAGEHWRDPAYSQRARVT